MPKYLLLSPVNALLLVMAFLTSCNGQNKTSQSQIVEGQSKIIKTQGTNKYGNVHCGLEDKDGNLWFGTTGEGVYMYDGKSFTQFTEQDGLSSNYVYSILEDKAGNIWFGTQAGLCRYDADMNAASRQEKTFTGIPISVSHDILYPSPSTAPTTGSQKEVVSMLQDKTGKLWFGTNDGVYCYNGASFTRFLDNDNILNKHGLHLKRIQSILEDKNGNIWFASWFEGLCRYDGRSLTQFKPNDEVWYASIFEDKDGNIWAGRRDKGVCRYDGKDFTNVLQNGIFDSCAVQPSVQDKEGNIWFATEFGDITRREAEGGVWSYDGKTFKNYTTKDRLPHNSVWCVVPDRAGNLWVGTRNTGLCRFDGKTFVSFSQ
jgi:ligand-binding sensor domain-containing protein